ncbi:hypothetical protein SGL43_05107 [Streptomyces globisporus]|uniref:Uncharacterized protein n=1 Tax=Streptomyces globisporus TaxID=1908 RepID=A0ABM9H374_STRGL|nr:hypothetical protein SGL43_05107 [Streptomyces globisporus]
MRCVRDIDDRDGDNCCVVRDDWLTVTSVQLPLGVTDAVEPPGPAVPAGREVASD